jgi:cobalamin biosynthesis protein CobD/CbiB
MLKEQARRDNKKLLLIGWGTIVAAVVVGTLMWTVWAPEKVMINSIHTVVLVPVCGYMGWQLEKFRKGMKEIWK